MQLKSKSERVVELEAANEDLKGRLQETLDSLERYALYAADAVFRFCFLAWAIRDVRCTLV